MGALRKCDLQPLVSDIPALLMKNPGVPQEPPKRGFGMAGSSLSFRPMRKHEVPVP
jgi:hypothetical protein